MSDDSAGPALTACPVCGAIGLPEQIRVHDCAAFRAWQHTIISSPSGSEGTADAD